ncbi:MAG: choice-of-anchor D domain-containing protein [Planctomycetes bacterium]|nr:choice-of-anchor D domain-containing protein [Planctomycetota bacterium]
MIQSRGNKGSGRVRAVAALIAFAVAIVASILPDSGGVGRGPAGPWGARDARAEDCRLDVPAPGAEPVDGHAGYVRVRNDVYGPESLPAITFSWTFDYTKYKDLIYDGVQGVNKMEIEFRDVTAGGDWARFAFQPASLTASGLYLIANTVAPETPDPTAVYLGRTYAFRVRAVAQASSDPTVPLLCAFPWSVEVLLTTPSDGTPGINVSSNALDFGNVELGFTAKRTLTVRNGDATPMTIKLPKSKAPFIHNARSPLVLDPNESADIEVTFSPDDEKASTQTFRLVGPKGVATVVVNLTGRGVPATPRLAFDVSTLDFGRLRGSAKKSVAVTNLTDQTLAVEISTPRPPFYRVSGYTLTLPPRGTAFVEFEFIPRENAATFTGSARFEVVNIRESPKQSLALTGGIFDTMIVKSTSTSGGTGVEYRILPGDWTKLLPGQELPPGAEIACDPDASVQLEMPDGTGIDMGPGTQIKVAAFFKKGGRVEAEILATFGDIVSRIPRHDVVRSDFKIRSPTATASVRGTAFTTSIDPATGDTTYRVTEGTVAVKPTARGSKTILVKAGNQVTVTKKGAGPITPYVP